MFESGTIIQNRYEIIEEVGSGGMSIVYKAKCHVLNRFVAMKVLKPEFADDKSFVKKFRVEAQSAAGLSHPNIVNVYDVGEENGYHYIVMELVEGITLKEYIQQNGRLPYQTALDFIMQITAGIQVAHEHHTIHRDIKPQNIIVSSNGTLKVTDFGIAKAATSNTVASSAMGSVHYISPEQARGGYSDERSDIYSLGITLYEMLVGRVPFEGENNVTVALMHIQSEIIPPREYYPDIPVGLEKIVLKATQKKPERRYLTTNAMLADLKSVVENPNAEVGLIGTVMSDNSPTIQISDEELMAIKSAAAMPTPQQRYPSSYTSEIELTQANSALESLYADEYEEYEEEDGYYDDDEEEEEIERREAIDEKTEKLLTIGAIVATVLIAIVLIVAIVSIASKFKKVEPTTELTTTQEQVLKMIEVVGYTEQRAIDALNEAKIPYEIERAYDDTFEEGIVMSQSILEGVTLNEGDKVKIIISKGKEMFKVPSVVGKSLDEATTILSAAGFKVIEDYKNDEEVEKDYIISQTPNAEEEAAKGSSVTVVVSKGKEVKVAVVPDLSKKTVTEAENALTSVNLKLGNVSQEYSDTVEEGKVITQSIAYGTEVKEETAIDITISKGEKPKTVTYTASFSGSISNRSYSFEEGETVRVTLVLKVGGAEYTLINDYYSEGSFPISLSDIANIEGLTTKDASLLYSVKDENGDDITGSFSCSGQASLKKVEQ
ncbi:MAG: Stk1 family PASTA domain-containing Ser/Thr kinase [Eubacteriales bacterium]|nr:Stk1 family PASTA domain-containing Ser/Thr kinase [Eubacteriales bacterium]